MKKIIFTLTALFSIMTSADAMSYEQAREQALFLTDKMAYELNLTDDQYEAAFEINFDYLLSIETQADLYSTYWTRRNLDLSYILLEWQYEAYLAAHYFYRPIYFDAGYWHFGIYARYPHRTFLYFGRPTFYVTYRGGHSWHCNGGRSWYHGRTYGHAHHHAEGHHGPGMRTQYDNGNYTANSVNRGYGSGRRGSSTRTTEHYGTSNRSGSTNNTGSTNNSSFGNRNIATQNHPSSTFERSSSFSRSNASSATAARSNSNVSGYSRRDIGSSSSSSFNRSSATSSGINRSSATSRFNRSSAASSFNHGSIGSTSSFSNRSSSFSNRSSSFSGASRGGGSFSNRSSSSFSGASRGGGSFGGGSHGGGGFGSRGGRR